jgi:hypothetical protein
MTQGEEQKEEGRKTAKIAEHLSLLIWFFLRFMLLHQLVQSGQNPGK